MKKHIYIVLVFLIFNTNNLLFSQEDKSADNFEILASEKVVLDINSSLYFNRFKDNRFNDEILNNKYNFNFEIQYSNRKFFYSHIILGYEINRLSKDLVLEDLSFNNQIKEDYMYISYAIFPEYRGPIMMNINPFLGFAIINKIDIIGLNDEMIEILNNKNISLLKDKKKFNFKTGIRFDLEYRIFKFNKFMTYAVLKMEGGYSSSNLIYNNFYYKFSLGLQFQFYMNDEVNSVWL